MKTGFNIELERKAQTGDEWIFGGLSQPNLASIPLNERWMYLPMGESQNIGDEKMDCATRSPINSLASQFTYLLKNKKLTPENEKFLRDNGYIQNECVDFSDRFIAILSGTTRDGNSLKAPLQAIENNGLIPKQMFPQVENFDEYYDRSKITDQMIALGKEFKERFTINYEKVYEVHYKDLLNDDLLCVAGYAWPDPVNGEYPKTDQEPNHAFILFKLPAYFAFDNYTDPIDGDYVKKLTENYDFLDYGYRVFVSSQQNITERNSLFLEILKKIGEVLGLIKKQVDIIAPLEVKEPTMQEKFLKVCLDALDTDPTPQDEVRDDVSCAFTLSTLLKKVLPDFPITQSTKDLDTKLFMDKRFKRVTEPERGVIVVSPRTQNTLGHCGVFTTSERIANNNSKNGLWQATYSWQSWIKEFRDRRGLHIYLYKLSA